MPKTLKAKEKQSKNGNKPKVEKVHIVELDKRILTLKLIGEQPLIMNNPEAFIEELEKAHTGKEKKKREAKDPEKLFQASRYIHPTLGDAIKGSAFKRCVVDACTSIHGMKKTEARQMFFILDDWVKINSKKPIMRRDLVRIGMNKPDIRYRAQYNKWWVELKIMYNASVISAEQLANFFHHAGFAVGVGEWRPSCNGVFGMFKVGN